MAAEPTVVFFPEGAYGPTNNCVGIGQVLQARGVRVVFIVEESFAGTLEARGFEERLMRLGPPPEVEEAPGQFWKDFIAATSPEFRKPTIEQLETFIAPTMGALVDGARYVEDRLCEIIDELQPDIVVEDNVVRVPGPAGPGEAVGAHRLVQPGRAPRPGRTARVLGLRRGRPHRLGRVLGGLRRAPRADVGAASTSSAASAARRRCRAASSSTSRPT